MVRLTDRPDLTLDVYRGRKTTHNNNNYTERVCRESLSICMCAFFPFGFLRWDVGFYYSSS